MSDILMKMFSEIVESKRQNEQKDNYNKFCDKMEYITPVKSETKNACHDFDNYQVGISVKNDYNYKGEVINRTENRFFIQKNK